MALNNPENDAQNDVQKNINKNGVEMPLEPGSKSADLGARDASSEGATGVKRGRPAGSPNKKTKRRSSAKSSAKPSSATKTDRIKVPREMKQAALIDSGALPPRKPSKVAPQSTQQPTPSEQTPSEQTPPEEVPAEVIEPAPIKTPPLSTAQRLLGIDYGESDEEVPDAEPLLVPALPHNVRVFIVLRTACGIVPRNIITQVKETYGITINASTVNRYDPTKVAGSTMRHDLKLVFAQMRREFQAVCKRTGIGDQDWRLQTMHNLCVDAVEAGATNVALKIMAQAAKDQGGMFVKTRKEGGEDNRALLARLLECSPDDLPPIPKSSGPRLPGGEA
jgi:hypothetical protein